ncbi:MAG: GNAT family N-acetyltransferase [archaeon]|nr:GNAT family N-acetyltransferase [archaeon]
MLIRKAKKVDIESIHKLDRESTRYHKKFDADFYTISEKWWKIKKDSQLKAIKSPTNLVLVAELDEKVVGYIWGYVETIMKNKIGKIQELIVTSKQRGKGIGKELIKRMLDFFKERECVISEIEVFVENLPTIQVYEKAGFKKREYKMQLKLNKTTKFRPFF